MKRFAVQYVVGDDVTTLKVCDTKEEMLQEKENFKKLYADKPGVVCGVGADMDEKGNFLANKDNPVVGAPFRVY
jgi:hypothetical protein